VIGLNVIFRVDATKTIGLGHLMRCYALAEELIKKGNNCFFLSNIEDERISETMRTKGIKIVKIETNPRFGKDIIKLLDFSKKNGIDWIITDHYDIDSTYIRELKKHSFKVLSIDDMSQIYYSSDVVVNQNVGSEKLEFKVDDGTKLLLGSEYVMIRDELLKRGGKRYNDKVEKILVTLGGIDYGNITIKILKILNEMIDNNIQIIVVIGALNRIEDDLKSKLHKLDNSSFRFVFSPENMAELYLESDIAISAGGSSCYELAYFGIPNIIITVADNQLNIAKELDKLNVSIYLGKKEDFSSNKIKENVLKLITDNSLRKKMSENGLKLVDGLGKKRIIEVMNKF